MHHNPLILRSTVPPLPMVVMRGYANKPLPEGLVDWGCDDELWSRTRNKKGLLDLLKKGDEERGRERILRMRKVVEEEDREALELRTFVLQREGALVVERRAQMVAAYEAAAAKIVQNGATAPSLRNGAAAKTAAAAAAVAQLQHQQKQQQQQAEEETEEEEEAAAAPASESDAEDEVAERLAPLLSRQATQEAATQAAKISWLKAQGKLTVERRAAARAAAIQYAQTLNATSLSAAPALAGIDAQPVVQAVDMAALAVTEAVTSVTEAAEVTADAAQRAYKASPASAFLPWPPPPSSPPPSSSPTTPLRSIEGRLAELDELLASGFLTTAEYESIRPQLLVGGAALDDDEQDEQDEEETDDEAASQPTEAAAGGIAYTPEGGADSSFRDALQQTLSELEAVEAAAEHAAEQPAEQPAEVAAMPDASEAGRARVRRDGEGELVPVLQGDSTLAPALSRTLALLDLYDPTAMSAEDQDKVSGAIATGTALLFPLLLAKLGFVPDLLVSTVFGGGVSGYCALRKDVVGAIARDVVGGTANLAVFTAAKRAQEVEDEYQVSKRAQERLARQIQLLTELQDNERRNRR